MEFSINYFQILLQNRSKEWIEAFYLHLLAQN